MQLKIPPAVQVLIFAFLIWAIHSVTKGAQFHFEHQRSIAWVIFGIGVFIGILAVISFQKAKTTVDPTYPGKASSLVTNGIYKISRNPMYLGLLFILISFIVRLGNFYCLPVLVLYIWYITKFQIKPEEEALQDIFSEEYHSYCRQVRRWI